MKYFPHPDNFLDAFFNLIVRNYNVGMMPVAFFFILSGFILSYRYQEKIKTKNLSKASFYIARLARIYPLHLLTMLVYLVLAFLLLSPISIWQTLLQIVSNLSLTQSFFSSNFAMSLNGVAWSLSVEFVFYILFPFFLFVKKELRWLITFVWMVLSIAYAFYYPSTGNGFTLLLYTFPLLRMPDFLLGMILFEIYTHFKRFQQVSKRTCSFFQAFSLVALGATLVFSYWAQSFSSIKAPTGLSYAIYYYIPCAFLILSFSAPRGFFKTILEAKYLVILGEASFAFYLIHPLVILPSKYLFSFFKGFYPPFSASYFLMGGTLMLFIFFVTLLLSVLSFYFFEKPMNTWVKKTFKRFKNRKEIMNSNL